MKFKMNKIANKCLLTDREGLMLRILIVKIQLRELNIRTSISELNMRTSNKILKDRVYDIARNPKYDGYQRELTSRV